MLHAAAGATAETTIPPLDKADAAPTPAPAPTPTPIPAPAPAPATAATHATATITVSESRRVRSRVHLALGLAAGGVATAIAGVSLAAWAKHDWTSAVAANAVSRANRDVHLADVGTGFAAASFACFAGAAIVYLTAPREFVTVTPTGTGVSLAVHGRF